MLMCYNNLGYKKWVTDVKWYLYTNGFGYVWERQEVTDPRLFLENGIDNEKFLAPSPDASVNDSLYAKKRVRRIFPHSGLSFYTALINSIQSSKAAVYAGPHFVSDNIILNIAVSTSW